MYKPITFLLKYIFKTAGKVEVQGREKLPEGGPYVVACTHTSFMDVLMFSYRDVPDGNSLHGQKRIIWREIQKLVL